jgi:thiamine biosynthesis lipoprotein
MMTVTRLPDGVWAGRFEAMASPCELLVDGGDAAGAERLLALAHHEAQRIERKYSRYRADSELSRWLAHGGKGVKVDDESAGLLDLAALCHTLSDGLFDISSGVLRAVWRFDGSDRVPDADAVARVAARVGWQRVRWERPLLTLPAGMELDLGGLGKEYAADRVLRLLGEHTTLPLLVNLGGDLVVSGPRANGEAWFVGVERPASETSGGSLSTAGLIALRGGALATSGDARRYLLKDGVRYSHILDPRSGWPVQGAPRSVTVAAPTCTEAGLMSTLAMLQGPGAEALLASQGLPHWVQR